MSSQQLNYLSGFGNEFATEGVAGALPRGQNSPQKAPLGLYTEQLSGSAFTAPRGANRRAWLYRIRPSVMHKPFRAIGQGLLRSGPFNEVPAPPGQFSLGSRCRCRRRRPISSAASSSPGGQRRCGPQQQWRGHSSLRGQHADARPVFLQRRRRTADRAADGRAADLHRAGRDGGAAQRNLRDSAGHPVPRRAAGRARARGYICENYGLPFRLPDLEPIGANGLANPRDFETPVAAFEDREGDFRLLAKFQGGLWEAEIDHSPLDVVGWHGNYAPCKYDLSKFNAINTVTFDHPDPSINTVLTSPTPTAGTANCDLAIFPPRWVVSEHTFRPPWYHRNIMSEFMGLIHGLYDAKAEGFLPGGASLHNCMSGHGPDAASFEAASHADLKPQYYGDTMAFMFETYYVIRPTRFAMESKILQHEYYECWQGLKKSFGQVLETA